MTSAWPGYKFCDDLTVMVSVALALGHKAFYICRTYTATATGVPSSAVTELSTLVSTSIHSYSHSIIYQSFRETWPWVLSVMLKWFFTPLICVLCSHLSPPNTNREEKMWGKRSQGKMVLSILPSYPSSEVTSVSDDDNTAGCKELCMRLSFYLHR